MTQTPFPIAPRRRGFSLLEVLLAVTIFSVCLVALYSTFRISTRAFESGRRSCDIVQTVRFTMDRVSRDLRGVFYETDYRARLNELNWTTWAKEDQLALADDVDDKNLLSGVFSTTSDDDEEGDTYAGLMLNLQFKGTDGGDTDQVEFTRYLPSDGTYDNSYLGAERIRYYVEGTDLYRQRERVTDVIRINPDWRDELAEAKELRDADTDAAERDPNLELIDFRAIARRGTLPEQYAPQHTVNYFVAEPMEVNPPELLAHNVTQFNLTYGYLEGQWAEADEWDSDGKEHRSPPFNLATEDPNFESMLADYQERADDGLPTFVRLTLTVDPRSGGGKSRGSKDGKKSTASSRSIRGKARTVQTIVWIPASLEGYLPEDYQGKYEPTVEEN